MGLNHLWCVAVVNTDGEQLSVDVQAESPTHALEVFLRDTGVAENEINQVHITFVSFGKVGQK